MIRGVADLLIREAHDTHTEAMQHLAPPSVVIREPFVLFSIPPDRSPGVDDEFGGGAVEVGDIAVERNLAAIPGSEPGIAP
jgi:hypothetical protein